MLRTELMSAREGSVPAGSGDGTDTALPVQEGVHHAVPGHSGDWTPAALMLGSHLCCHRSDFSLSATLSPETGLDVFLCSHVPVIPLPEGEFPLNTAQEGRPFRT